jgi:hypothetical protein
MDLSKHMLFQSVRLVGAVGIEFASLIYKSHRTKALPTALGFNCCQMLPTKLCTRPPLPELRDLSGLLRQFRLCLFCISPKLQIR